MKSRFRGKWGTAARNYGVIKTIEGGTDELGLSSFVTIFFYHPYFSSLRKRPTFLGASGQVLSAFTTYLLDTAGQLWRFAPIVC